MANGKTILPEGRSGKVQLATFVPQDVYEAVAHLAAAEDRSIAAILRRAITAELEKATA